MARPLDRPNLTVTPAAPVAFCRTAANASRGRSQKWRKGVVGVRPGVVAENDLFNVRRGWLGASGNRRRARTGNDFQRGECSDRNGNVRRERPNPHFGRGGDKLYVSALICLIPQIINVANLRIHGVIVDDDD